ncbi:MAG: type II toxin-antitoxin system MqsA family antitoxin [Deltaproteobacteria bacterium]|nr:type II toxin-antitoxin system MqsA family antitoxin [Deltaproteobacteria bacterium]
MVCVFCGGKAEEKEVTFSYEEGDKYILVEHVPARVCANCGEKTYSPEVADELRKFAKAKCRPIRVLSVPVFDYGDRV